MTHVVDPTAKVKANSSPKTSKYLLQYSDCHLRGVVSSVRRDGIEEMITYVVDPRAK